MGMVFVHQAPLLSHCRIGQCPIRTAAHLELEVFRWLNSVGLHCSLFTCISNDGGQVQRNLLRSPRPFRYFQFTTGLRNLFRHEDPRRAVGEPAFGRRSFFVRVETV
jgi:hypothetical protein